MNCETDRQTDGRTDIRCRAEEQKKIKKREVGDILIAGASVSLSEKFLGIPRLSFRLDQ